MMRETVLKRQSPCEDNSHLNLNAACTLFLVSFHLLCSFVIGFGFKREDENKEGEERRKEEEEMNLSFSTHVHKRKVENHICSLQTWNSCPPMT